MVNADQNLLKLKSNLAKGSIWANQDGEVRK